MAALLASLSDLQKPARLSLRPSLFSWVRGLTAQVL
jgi:hypothetical protein